MALRYLCIGSAYYTLQQSTQETPNIDGSHAVEMRPITTTTTNQRPQISILAEYPSVVGDELSSRSASPSLQALSSSNVATSASTHDNQGGGLPRLPSQSLLNTTAANSSANMLKKIFDSLVFVAQGAEDLSKEAMKTSQFGLLPQFFSAQPTSPRARMIEDTRSNWNYYYLANPTSVTSGDGFATAESEAVGSTGGSDGRIIIGCVTTSDVRKRSADSFLEQVLSVVSAALHVESINENVSGGSHTTATFRNEFQALSKLQLLLQEQFAAFGEPTLSSGGGTSKAGIIITSANGVNNKASNFVQNVLHSLVASPGRRQKLTAVDLDSGSPVDSSISNSISNRNKYNSLDADEDDEAEENFGEGLVELRKQQSGQQDLQVIYSRPSMAANHNGNGTGGGAGQTHSSAVVGGTVDQADTKGSYLRKRRLLIIAVLVVALMAAVAIVIYVLFFRRKEIKIIYEVPYDPPLR